MRAYRENSAPLPPDKIRKRPELPPLKLEKPNAAEISARTFAPIWLCNMVINLVNYSTKHSPLMLLAGVLHAICFVTWTGTWWFYRRKRIEKAKDERARALSSS